MPPQKVRRGLYAMDKDVAITMIQVLGPAIMAVLAFIGKSVVGQIRRDLLAIEKDIARVEGSLSTLQADMRANTVAVTQATSELKAIWRFIDAPKRASDG